MERDINGVSEKQSGLGLVIDHLYGFFFESRKQQYVVYGVSFLIAFAYAILSDLALGRSQHEVIIESTVLASVLLISLPIAYVSGSIRREGSNLPSLHSTESPAGFQSVAEPAFAFAPALSLAHINELTQALRTIQSNEERQRQTQDLIATAISRIDAAQQQIPPAIQALARAIGEGQSALLQEQLDAIGNHFREAISVGLSVAVEQRTTHLVAMLSKAIEQHHRELIRMLSQVLEQQTGSFSTFRVPESSESELRQTYRSRGYAFDQVPAAR